MTIEAYRAKIKKRFIFYLVASIIFVILVVLRIVLNKLNSSQGSFLDGFKLGLFSALSFVFFAKCFFLFRAMINEDKLRKLFIEENDERTKAINEKSGSNLFIIIYLILVIGIMISGNFSDTVMYSLLGCIGGIIVIYTSLHLYFSKKL